MDNIVIDIARDFTLIPGARTYEDGDFSGQEFFDKLLKDNFKKALDNNVKLEIILDGTNGYASSFLDEFGRLLADEFGKKSVLANLEIISNEIPRFKELIIVGINESKK